MIRVSKVYYMNSFYFTKEIANKIMTNNRLWAKAINTQQQQPNKTSKRKIPCRSWELNTGPPALQSGVLPVDHRVNLTCRLKSSYLTVSALWVKT